VSAADAFVGDKVCVAAVPSHRGKCFSSRTKEHDRVRRVRGLFNAQPEPDRRKPNEGEVIRSELVVPRCGAPTLLDLVKEPFDQVSRLIQIWAEADCLVAVSFLSKFGRSSIRGTPRRLFGNIGMMEAHS
jgi:hypothetical protein